MQNTRARESGSSTKRRIYRTSIQSMNGSTRSMRRWTSLRFQGRRRKRSASIARLSFTWTLRSTITKRTSEWLCKLMYFLFYWLNNWSGFGLHLLLLFILIALLLLIFLHLYLHWFFLDKYLLFFLLLLVLVHLFFLWLFASFSLVLLLFLGQEWAYLFFALELHPAHLFPDIVPDFSCSCVDEIFQFSLQHPKTFFSEEMQHVNDVVGPGLFKDQPFDLSFLFVHPSFHLNHIVFISFVFDFFEFFGKGLTLFIQEVDYFRLD